MDASPFDNYMKNIPFMGSIVKLVELVVSTYSEAPEGRRGFVLEQVL